MLLGTASTPSLRSSPLSYPASDPNLPTRRRARPFLLTLPPAPPGKKILTTSSVEADLFKGLPLKARKGLSPAEQDGHFPFPTEEEESAAGAEEAAFLLSCSVAAMEERSGLLVGGGAEDGGGGGGMCSRGGGGGGREWDGRGSESLDEHYQSLIKSNTGDALLLGNYARFLKDVKISDFFLMIISFSIFLFLDASLAC